MTKESLYSNEFVYDTCLSSDVKFDESDFILIKQILSFFRKGFVTPYILAEFSNISRSALKGEKRKIFFEAAISTFSSKEETPFSLKSISGIGVEILSEYGFTDVGLLEIARKEGVPILTIDDPVTRYAETQVPVIKYQRIRTHKKINA